MTDSTKLSAFAVTETVGEMVQKIGVYAITKESDDPPEAARRRRVVAFTVTSMTG